MLKLNKSDAVRFAIGDVIYKRIAPEFVGQVIAIVFYEAEIAYMVRFMEGEETLSWFEIKKTKDPQPD